MQLTPEQLQGMQRQIEHCLRDYAGRIRNTNDPGTVARCWAR
jgi:hypothetical protein